MNQKQIFNKIRNRIAFSILFSLACATSAIAADKISIGYLSSTGQGKFFIAKDAGIFEKNGLDVTLVEFSNSGDGIAAVRAGNWMQAHSVRSLRLFTFRRVPTSA